MAGPGIAVGVVRGDEIVYLHGFGNRSQDAPLPVTPNTVLSDRISQQGIHRRPGGHAGR